MVPDITEIVVAAQAVGDNVPASNGINKGCLTTSPYYQIPVSQANLLKYEKTTCIQESSRENDTAIARKISVVLTAYSSTVEETDSTPFITANGSYVHDGVIANNMLPFGTKVKIPALYGDKIFLVEDRMHWRKSDYHFDIWFPSHQQAEQFGVKYAFLEILK
jgi:3D (Asp-Asp-Asp) domain-containing protein